MIVSCAQLAAHSTAYFSNLYSGPVASSGEEALQRIVNKYGSIPNKWGTNNPDIIRIRKFLYSVCNDKARANGFIIYAPHTHWSPTRPIIIWKNPAEEFFNIGNKELEFDRRYFPVSFVFRDGQPIAYEWLELLDDDSKGVNIRMYTDALDIIRHLGRSRVAETLPFGLSLHFKFRQIFSEDIIPTQEINRETASSVASLDGANFDNQSFEQVGWHAISDMFLCENDHEVKVLKLLRLHLESLDGTASRATLLNQLNVA